MQAGRQAGRQGRLGGRAEWWQLRPGRTGSKETAPQTVSERFPAGQHSLPSSTPPKGELIILLIWPPLSSFCKRKWDFDLEETRFGQRACFPCFPNLRPLSGGGNKAKCPAQLSWASSLPALFRLISHTQINSDTRGCPFNAGQRVCYPN